MKSMSTEIRNQNGDFPYSNVFLQPISTSTKNLEELGRYKDVQKHGDSKVLQISVANLMYRAIASEVTISSEYPIKTYVLATLRTLD